MKQIKVGDAVVNGMQLRVTIDIVLGGVEEVAATGAGGARLYKLVDLPADHYGAVEAMKQLAVGIGKAIKEVDAEAPVLGVSVVSSNLTAEEVHGGLTASD
jgi:hypothetical protein